MRNYLIVGLIGLALGAGITRAYFLKTVTKTEVKERVVNHIVTQERETVKPDGSKVVERVITDTGSKISQESKIVETAPKAPGWKLSGGVGTDNALNTFYVVGVERRIAGPAWVGISAATNGTVMGTVGIEF